MPIPLLLISDAVTAGTGLSRITRDLATRIAECLPEVFTVGTLGYGGPFSRHLPFPQYQIDKMDSWVINNLEEVWQDFAGDQKGIVLVVWDSSRLLWFSRPENCPDPYLAKFLTNPPFQKWTYTPIDATGPNDKLTAVLGHTLDGFDRVLAYSSWAEQILRRSLASRPILDGLTWLPHGIDTSVFYPRNRTVARHGFGEKLNLKTLKNKWFAIPDDVLLVGIVGTNQTRKDWALGVQTVKELSKTRKVILWANIDILERHWSLPALLNDFGVAKDTVITGASGLLTDEQLAWAYSACDVTLSIGLGEGFGYAAAESLACGTPVVAPAYGGGEFIPEEFLVYPQAWRMEGAYCCVRPVMHLMDFAAKADRCSSARPLMRGISLLPSRYDWNNLWPEWRDWLVQGVAK